MHIKFIDQLCDPITKENLVLDLKKSTLEGDICNEGYLNSSTSSYPIKNGVVRFLSNSDYNENFGWQWNHWPRVQFDSENVGKPMEGWTTMMWESVTGIKKDQNLKNKITLDLGCGPGRFIEVARKRGSMVIGLDYSHAVDAAQKNFSSDPDVCIIQADAMNLPIKNDAIDAAFSIGVLHHTPDPENGVKEIYRILKNKAWFAMSVYGSGYYDFPTVTMWRKIFKFTWKFFGEWPPLIYTYFVITFFRPIANISRPLGLAIRVFFPFINLQDKNWALLDTFDSITPSYQSSHESFEVYTWFKSHGYVDIEPTNWGNTSYRGFKK